MLEGTGLSPGCHPSCPDLTHKLCGIECRVSSGIDDNFTDRTTEQYVQTIQNIAAQNAFVADNVRLQSARTLITSKDSPG